MVDRSIRQMVFTSNGKRAVATHRDGYQIWNVDDGSRGLVLAHESPGDLMAASPNGKVLATADDAGRSVQLWDLKTGEKTAQVTATDSLMGLCFLSDTKLLGGFAQGSLRIWDLGGDSSLFEGPWKDASTLACAAKAGWVTIGTENGNAFAIQLDTKNFTATKTIKLGSASKSITTTAIAPDASAFAFGSTDQSIYFWYTPEAAEPFSIPAHERTVEGLAFSPDSREIYSTGGDWWFRKWNPKTGELLEEIPGIDGLEAQLMALAPDGKRMISWSKHSGARGSEAGRWWLWDIQTGDILLEPQRHRGPITAARFSHDGTQVATSSEDRTIHLWDAKSTKSNGRLDGAGGPVNDVHFSPDDRTVYSAGDDALVRAWVLESDQENAAIENVGAAVNRFLLSHDRQRFITGDQVGRVWSWDRKTKKRGDTYDAKRYSAIYDIAQSPDGVFLAIAGSASVVGVIDLKLGQEIAELNTGETAAVFAVAFSPDGSLLATAGDDHKIQLWKTSDWSKQATLEGHDGTVRALTFHPNGKLLISGGNDEVVRIWQVASGEQTAQLEGHDGVVTSVSVSPDGRQIVSASRDRTALIWELPEVERQ